MPVLELMTKNIVVIDSVFFDDAVKYLRALPRYLIYTKAMASLQKRAIEKSKSIIDALTDLEFCVELISKNEGIPLSARIEGIAQKYNSTFSEITSGAETHSKNSRITIQDINAASKEYVDEERVKGINLYDLLNGGGPLEHQNCADFNGLKAAQEIIKIAKSRGAEVCIYGSSFHRPVH